MPGSIGRHRALDPAEHRHARRRGRRSSHARSSSPPRARSPRSLRAVVLEQVGGAEIARDQDDVVGQLGPDRGSRACRQDGAAGGWRCRRGRSAARAGRDRSAWPMPDAGLLLDAAHRRLGGEPGADRLADAPQPARVVREHPVGLEHLALLAAAEIAASPASGRATRAARDRPLEPRELGLRVVGRGAGRPRPAARAARRGRSPRPRPGAGRRGAASRQAAAARSAYLLGSISPPEANISASERGDDLHRLDLVLGIGAPGPVLHREHADDAAGAQDRHAEERVVDLLAGLREIAEVGVGLRVGGVDDRRPAPRSCRPGPRRPASASGAPPRRRGPSVANSSSTSPARLK